MKIYINLILKVISIIVVIFWFYSFQQEYIYKSKILVFGKEFNNEYIELYNNDSLIYKDTIRIDPSVDVEWFEIIGTEPEVTIKSSKTYKTVKLNKNFRNFFVKKNTFLFDFIYLKKSNEILQYD